MKEIKTLIKSYVSKSIEELESAMCVIEENNEINNGQEDEISEMYRKLSSAVEILESL